MPVLRNPKHERFAQEIANGRSQLEAYKTAGFRPDVRNAKRLRDRRYVQSRIDQILEEREKRAALSVARAIEKAAITKADVLSMLIEDRALARKKGQASAAIRADELLGKELGMFINREEVGNPGDFASLSQEELEQRLRDELMAGGIPEKYARAFFENRGTSRASRSRPH